MGCAIRVSDDIRVTIRVQNERAAIPQIHRGDRVNLKMAFTRVFRVYAKDPTRLRMHQARRLQVTGLKSRYIDDLSDDGRSAPIIPGRPGARGIDRHVDVKITVARWTRVRDDIFPVSGELR